MCERTTERETFGRKFSDRSYLRQEIANSFCDIEQARLLTLSAADTIDKHGVKGAKDLIAMIKIVAPKMACEVIDRAIQIHGGMGVCSDTPLAAFYAASRTLRLADGPDEVHMYQLGRNTVKQYLAQVAETQSA
jgi:acyl-CoA dehydrogenase